MNLDTLKQRAKTAKNDALALSYSLLDPRTPWYAKAIVVLTVAYALSPIDLIPDFIPVLGMLDDLLIVPAGVALALRLTPPDVINDARAKLAEGGQGQAKGLGRAAAAVILLIWALIFFLILKTVIG